MNANNGAEPEDRPIVFQCVETLLHGLNLLLTLFALPLYATVRATYGAVANYGQFRNGLLYLYVLWIPRFLCILFVVGFATAQVLGTTVGLAKALHMTLAWQYAVVVLAQLPLLVYGCVFLPRTYKCLKLSALPYLIGVWRCGCDVFDAILLLLVTGLISRTPHLSRLPLEDDLDANISTRTYHKRRYFLLWQVLMSGVDWVMLPFALTLLWRTPQACAEWQRIVNEKDKKRADDDNNNSDSEHHTECALRLMILEQWLNMLMDLPFLLLLVSMLCMLMPHRLNRAVRDAFALNGKSNLPNHQWLARRTIFYQWLLALLDIPVLAARVVVWATHYRQHRLSKRLAEESDGFVAPDAALVDDQDQDQGQDQHEAAQQQQPPNKRATYFAVAHIIALSELSQMLMDVPFAVLGLVVTLTIWRAPNFWSNLLAKHVGAGQLDPQDYNYKLSQWEMRWFCVTEFIQLLIDLPFILLFFCCIISPIRLPFVARDVLFHIKARDRRVVIFQHLVMAILDWPAWACLLVVTCSGYRSARIWKKLTHQSTEGFFSVTPYSFYDHSIGAHKYLGLCTRPPPEPRNDLEVCSQRFDAHGYCVMELLSLLLDLPFIAMGGVVFCTLFRAPTLWRKLKLEYNGPSSYRHCEMRVLCLIQFGLFILDLFVACVFALCFVLGLLTGRWYLLTRDTLKLWQQVDLLHKAENMRLCVLHHTILVWLDYPSLWCAGLSVLLTAYRFKRTRLEIQRTTVGFADYYDASADLKTNLDVLSRAHLVVLHTFCSILCDLPCLVPYLVALICPWRSALMRQQVAAIPDRDDATAQFNINNGARRIVVLKHFALALLDVPCVVGLLLFTLLTMWRLHPTVRALRQLRQDQPYAFANSWQPHGVIAGNFLYAVVTLPFSVMCWALALSLWRANKLLVVLNLDEELPTSHRTYRLCQQFLWLLLDLPAILLAVCLMVTWRSLRLWGSLAAHYAFASSTTKVDNNGQLDGGKIHWIVFGEFANLLLDLPFVALSVFSFWRCVNIGRIVWQDIDVKSDWDKRLLVARQAYLVCVDVVALVCVCLMLPCVWRWKSLVGALTGCCSTRKKVLLEVEDQPRVDNLDQQHIGSEDIAVVDSEYQQPLVPSGNLELNPNQEDAHFNEQLNAMLDRDEPLPASIFDHYNQVEDEPLNLDLNLNHAANQSVKANFKEDDDDSVLDLYSCRDGGDGGDGRALCAFNLRLDHWQLQTFALLVDTLGDLPYVVLTMCMAPFLWRSVTLLKLVLNGSHDTSALSMSMSTAQQRRTLILQQSWQLLLDLPCVFLASVVVGLPLTWNVLLWSTGYGFHTGASICLLLVLGIPWRGFVLLSDVCHHGNCAPKNRRAACHHFVLYWLDLLCVGACCLLLLTGYRIPNVVRFWRKQVAHAEDARRRVQGQKSQNQNQQRAQDYGTFPDEGIPHADAAVLTIVVNIAAPAEVKEEARDPVPAQPVSFAEQLPSQPPPLLSDVVRVHVGLLKEAINVVVDLPFMALAAVVMLCLGWRAPQLIRDWKTQPRHAEADEVDDDGRSSSDNWRKRVLCFNHFVNLLLDLVFIVMALVIVGTLYRAKLLLEQCRSDKVKHVNDRRAICWNQFVALCLDLPCIALGLLVTVAPSWLWLRAFTLWRDIAHHTHSAPERRVVVLQHCVLWLADWLSLPFLLLVCCTGYRIPRLWAELVAPGTVGFFNTYRMTIAKPDPAGQARLVDVNMQPTTLQRVESHLLIWKQGALVLVDAFFALLAVVILSTMWRAHTLGSAVWQRVDCSCYKRMRYRMEVRRRLRRRQRGQNDDDDDGRRQKKKGFARVPVQVVGHVVVPLLDVRDLCMLGRVNKELHAMESSKFVWYSRFVQRWPNNKNVVEGRAGRLANAVLDLSDEESDQQQQQEENVLTWKDLYAQADLAERPYDPHFGANDRVEYEGWLLCGMRKVVWRQFVQWCIDLIFVAMFCVCFLSGVRTFFVLRDVFGQCDTAKQRRRAVAWQFLFLLLDPFFVALLPLLFVGLFYRFEAAVKEIRTLQLHQYSAYQPLVRNNVDRLKPYGVVVYEFFGIVVDTPFNLMYAICWCALGYRGATVWHQMKAPHNQLMFSRGEHRCIVAYQFVQLLIDVFLVPFAVTLAVVAPWRAWKFVSTLRDQANGDWYSLTSWKVRLDLFLHWLLIVPDWLVLLGTVVITVTFWRLPTLYASCRRHKGIYRATSNTLYLMLKDVATVLLLVPLIVLGIQQVPSFVRSVRLVQQRFRKEGGVGRGRSGSVESKSADAEPESESKAVVAAVERAIWSQTHASPVRPNPNPNQDEADLRHVLYVGALHDLRYEDGFGLHRDSKARDDYVSGSMTYRRCIDPVADASFAQELEGSCHYSTAYRFCNPSLGYTDYPFSLSLFRSIIAREAWLSFTGFPHVLLFPVRVVAHALYPVYWYIRLRQGQMGLVGDKVKVEQQHSDGPLNQVVVVHSEEQKQQHVQQDQRQAKPCSVHFTGSFWFDLVNWLYQHCPTPMFNWQQFYLMERFLLVNLLCLLPLLCNEVAVVWLGVNTLFINLLTCGRHQFAAFSNKCDAIVTSVSIVAQGLLAPVFLALQLLMGLLPLIVYSVAHSNYTNVGRLFTQASLAAWLCEALMLLAMPGAVQLLVRYCRFANTMFRPYLLYVVLLTSVWNTIQGKGIVWKLYKSLLGKFTHWCYTVARQGAACKWLGNLLLMCFLAVWCCWPSVPPLATHQYWWLFLTVPACLLLAYRSQHIVLDHWRVVPLPIFARAEPDPPVQQPV